MKFCWRVVILGEKQFTQEGNLLYLPVIVFDKRLLWLLELVLGWKQIVSVTVSPIWLFMNSQDPHSIS